jgi:hypothetical protein
MGAAVVNTKVGNGYTKCLLTESTLNPQPTYLDGGNWRGSGVNTHFFYVQKADGGTWDLSPAGEGVKFAFAGAVSGNIVPSPFILANYIQPVLYACGPGGYRRYNPVGDTVMMISGNTFSASSAINLASGGGDWRAPAGTMTNLTAVSRIEVLLALADPFDGGVPSFDAGITMFGFFPP